MLHSLRLDKLSEQNYPIDLHNLQKEGERKGERKGEMFFFFFLTISEQNIYIRWFDLFIICHSPSAYSVIINYSEACRGIKRLHIFHLQIFSSCSFSSVKCILIGKSIIPEKFHLFYLFSNIYKLTDLVDVDCKLYWFFKLNIFPGN